MLLKSMELQGFKTFPDKTKLNFDNGITAVVGPNGSGKSNISDAIRWALGEQSAKTLRCSKMEDVVFNGSDKRKRQGFAEVTLTFDNKDRALQFDNDNVDITRRYYRSGESEYLINKNIVRLKDIHELFMDTGLGRDGYSMIGQGKIDEIVSSKNEDRREIFEEAAGISRYRYRKIEAERKLTQTETNLVRLRDIVTELEDRVGPLEAQAKKAEDFLKFSQERKGLEIALWLDTLNKSSNVLKEQEDKVSVARSQNDDIGQKLEDINSQTEEIYLQNGRLSSQIDDIRRQNDDNIAKQGEIKSKISVFENDILHNNQTISRLNEEVSSIINGADLSKTLIEQKQEQITVLNQKNAKLQDKYNDIANKLNQITIESSRSGDEFQTHTQNLTVLNTNHADCRVKIVTCDASIKELGDRISASCQSLDSGKAQLAQLTDIMAGYDKQISDNLQATDSVKNAINGIELKLNNKKSKAEQLKSQIDNITLDAQEKLRRAKLLESLEQNLEGFTHSVKIVMQGRKNGRLRGILGPVSRIISVPAQYSLAIETALGAVMQNIVTSTEDDAKQAIRFLKQNDGGRATFLPITNIKGKILNEGGLTDCYGFVGVASELCTCDKQFGEILISLLGRTVIAEDLDSATKIAKKYNYKFKVVSLDGQVINTGGSLTGGSANKKSGLLSRTADIEGFKSESDKLFKQAEGIRQEYDNIKNTIDSLEFELLKNKNEYNALLQDYARLKAERNACNNEITNINNNKVTLNEQIKLAQDKIESFKSQKIFLSEELDKLNQKIAYFEEQINSITGSRADLSAQREELSAQIQNIRIDIIAVKKDIENLENEINVAKSSDLQRLNRQNDLKAELQSLENTNKEILSKIGEHKSQLEDLQNNIDNLAKLTNDINVKRDELEKTTLNLRQQEKDLMSDKEVITRELARLEERKINLQAQYDDIIKKLWEEYELTRRQAEEISLPIENITQANKRLNELKGKIKALGSVNVSAIEEYKEVSERYNFISSQVNDIEKSKKEIEALINKLTHQMKDVFIKSFNEINGNFTQTFRELFGGGTASLVLSEPESILTSGIDIMVHPPGKIVSHLEALSGGEKALVAIALYFSIMKVRPAPFCVLDEIEAALDDVNVERFAKYMRTLCHKSQFICITHRRGTMEEADVLYGVTMQDEGVSKMLSLKTSEIAAKLGI